MLVLMCDRCGKSIDEEEKTAVPFMEIHITLSKQLKHIYPDLCLDCRKELVDWLNIGKSTPSPCDDCLFKDNEHNTCVIADNYGISCDVVTTCPNYKRGVKE